MIQLKYLWALICENKNKKSLQKQLQLIKINELNNMCLHKFKKKLIENSKKLLENVSNFHFLLFKNTRQRRI